MIIQPLHFIYKKEMTQDNLHLNHFFFISYNSDFFIVIAGRRPRVPETSKLLPSKFSFEFTICTLLLSLADAQEIENEQENQVSYFNIALYY